MPPRFEGLPTASSQTVPLDDALFPFSHFGGGGEHSNFPFGQPDETGSGFDAALSGYDLRIAPGSIGPN